jgi:hypothetical protein
LPPLVRHVRTHDVEQDGRDGDQAVQREPVGERQVEGHLATLPDLARLRIDVAAMHAEFRAPDRARSN